MSWTASDGAEQSGRIALVTGANSGLGFEAARWLAHRGATVILGCRDEAKARTAAARIGGQTETLHLDLASLESVRAAVEELRSRHSRLDLLINNAAVMMTPRQTTADGFELQFGVNYLGHFALTGLLLDPILSGDSSRIVSQSSLVHAVGRRTVRLDDVQGRGRHRRFAAYAQSKLAIMLFTFELQRRLAASGARAIAVAAHPGVVKTNLDRHLPRAFRLPIAVASRQVGHRAELGVLPLLRAATDPEVRGGQYYGPSGLGQTSGGPVLVRPGSRSQDADAQRRLWAMSEDLTGVTYGFGADRSSAR